MKQSKQIQVYHLHVLYNIHVRRPICIYVHVGRLYFICMCVYIGLGIHVCMSIRKCACMCVCMYLFMHACCNWLHACTYAWHAEYACTCTVACMRVCACMYVCMYLWMYVCLAGLSSLTHSAKDSRNQR